MPHSGDRCDRCHGGVGRCPVPSAAGRATWRPLVHPDAVVLSFAGQTAVVRDGTFLLRADRGPRWRRAPLCIPAPSAVDAITLVAVVMVAVPALWVHSAARGGAAAVVGSVAATGRATRVPTHSRAFASFALAAAAVVVWSVVKTVSVLGPDERSGGHPVDRA